MFILQEGPANVFIGRRVHCTGLYAFRANELVFRNLKYILFRKLVRVQQVLGRKRVELRNLRQTFPLSRRGM